MPKACPEAPAHASAGVTTAREPSWVLPRGRGLDAPASLWRTFSGPALRTPCSAPSASAAGRGLPGLAVRAGGQVQVRYGPLLGRASSGSRSLLPPRLTPRLLGVHPDLPFRPAWTQCPQPHVAVHSPPSPTPALQQLSSRCSCGASSQGRALGRRRAWAGGPVPQRGRICSEGSERPRAGSRVRGSPGPPRQEAPPPKDHVAKWPPAPFTRTGCLCAHVGLALGLPLGTSNPVN